MQRCCAVLVCLSTCGFVLGNRARLSVRAASPSTRPLGVYIYAVGPRSCRIRRAQKGSARLRPETKPRLAPSGVRRGARGLGLTPAPCAAAPVVFAAIRAAMLRRRDTAFSPCDVSHRASDEPRRCMSLSSALAPSSLASPSIRRVFLRSICAPRLIVVSLNYMQQLHDKSAAQHITNTQTGILQRFRWVLLFLVLTPSHNLKNIL